ncbi:MAG: hypothetical protein ABL949_05630 [Fimbriimonadaceae bacterium]
MIAGASLAQQGAKPWKLEFESGLTSSRYNNARVPKSAGTNVDLAGLIGKEWKAFGRVSLFYEDKAGGTWKLLYAPFRQSGSGTLAVPTNFAGQTFAPGAAQATYQFNSYRLTYRKPWKGGWSIGGTLKIRDAEILLKQGAVVASERNVGFVPLLNIFGEGEITRGLMYEVELDGLAGGPGRALDLSLRVKRQFGPGTTAFVGFRVLEGGADVSRVKNFAWVNYITVGIGVRF